MTFDEQYPPVGVTSTASHRDLRDRDRLWVNGFAAVVPLADLEGQRGDQTGANRVGRFSDISEWTLV